MTIEREKLELEEYKKEVEDLKNQLKAKNERLDERSDNILQKRVKRLLPFCAKPRKQLMMLSVNSTKPMLPTCR